MNEFHRDMGFGVLEKPLFVRCRNIVILINCRCFCVVKYPDFCGQGAAGAYIKASGVNDEMIFLTP